MGRRDDDESDDDRKPRKSGGLPVWAVLLIVIVPIVVVCGGGAAVAYVFARNVGAAVNDVMTSAKRQEEPRPTVAGRSWPVEPERKRYTRAEFTKLVVGKTQAEVIQAVGKPDSTSESGGRVWWYYSNTTTDPITGKTDQSIQLVFEDGKVSEVNY